MIVSDLVSALVKNVKTSARNNTWNFDSPIKKLVFKECFYIKMEALCHIHPFTQTDTLMVEGTMQGPNAPQE